MRKSVVGLWAHYFYKLEKQDLQQILLFDVDGTLTPSRQRINKEFENWFCDFISQRKYHIGVVTGSDYPKTVEQLGSKICESIGRSFNCLGNDVWAQGKNIYTNPWQLPGEAEYFLLEKLFQSDYKIRTGNHIEHRPGLCNFSVVGRNADIQQRQEYHAFDDQTGERIRIATELGVHFPDLEARVGGEISIDIYPKGADKQQVIDTLEGECYVRFFGDQTDPTGNDHTIAQRIINDALGEVFTVSNWEETWELLRSL
jgi:phosphomannomutase